MSEEKLQIDKLKALLRNRPVDKEIQSKMKSLSLPLDDYKRRYIFNNMVWWCSKAML